MVVDVDEYGPAVCDRGNFRALKILLRDGGSLDPLGDVVDNGGHVYVKDADLRSWAGPRPALDPGWLKRFEVMLAVARDHGWVREDGRIKVHVEFAS